MQIPETTIFARHATGADLPALCRKLFDHQRVNWPMCRDGVAALDSVETRAITCDGYTVHLQYNPRRIISTAAKVDAVSIKQRACFLCVDKLPQEQKGILFGEDYLILCNPAPIFREHFTIVHRDHRPQEIVSELDTMIALARAMAPAYTVFYNGPRCGASAPDHLHLQSVPRKAIPADAEVLSQSHRGSTRRLGNVEVSSVRSYGRSVVTLRGRKDDELVSAFGSFVNAWRMITGENAEPMMNVLCWHEEEWTTLVVFLRRKHRPDVYSAEGDAKVVISPAAVDIGGWIVTPVERDFRTVDAAMVRSIFAEVSLSDTDVNRIVEAL